MLNMLKIVCMLTFLVDDLGSLLAISYDTTIYVNNCLNRSVSDKTTWTRGIAFEMSAYITGNRNLELIWEIYRLSDNKTSKINVKYFRGQNFVIQPYTLTEGFYKIIVLSIEEPEYKMKTNCFLRIQPEPSFAFIAGGSKREYRPKEVIMADGSASKDYCYPEGKQNSLVYSWTCKQTKSNGFCPHIVRGKVKKFIIPKEYAVEGEEFTIILTVENEDRFKSTTTQRINVRSNVKHLKMSCNQNCPPWGRAGSITELRINCVKYCGDPCESSWVFNALYKTTPQSEYEEICKSDSRCFYRILNPGDVEFIYNCRGQNVSGRTSLTIDYKPNSNLTCIVNPKEGKSYTTQFQVSCEVDTQEIIQTIEIFLFDEKADNGLGDFITLWTPPLRHTFSLPEETEKILVRAYIHSEIYSHTVLNVKVAKEFPSDNPEKFIIRTLDLYMGNKEQSVKHYLMNKYDSNKALSMIRSFWRDIKPTSNPSYDHSEDVDSLMLHTIDDLLTLPILTADDLIQVNNAIKSMLSSYDEKPNALTMKHLSILCKKIAYNYVKLMENKEDEKLQSAVKKIDVTKTLADCSDKIITEDKDLLKPENVTKNTTDEGKPGGESITEYYKDYVDFPDEYYSHLEDLEEAGSNVVQLSNLLVKTIADSIEEYGSKIFSSKTMKMAVFKNPGQFYKKRVGVGGIRIQPSTDIIESKDGFLFKILSWTKNIFWWSPSKFKPTTYIGDISVVNMRTGQTLSKFRKHHTVYLSVVNDTSGEIERKTFSVMVPAAYHRKRIQEDYMNDYVMIHRIDLFQRQGLLVEFSNLENRRFCVVVKNFELPVIEDFSKNDVIVVDKKNQYVTYENTNPYDSWYYLGILPHRDMVEANGKNQTFAYTIVFFGPACYKWTFDKSWIRTCVAGRSTKSRIICKCSHLSIIAARLESPSTRALDTPYAELELSIETRREIFYCVFALFSAYCILLLYGRRKHEVYYAADNNYNDRYAYLVVVRTGRFRQLTSRIVIKIMGSEGKTSPHVLNYPDPYHRIFQAGSEDWIIVTTPQSLGNVQNIELWHDNFGLKPTWYCKDIVIHDIQTQTKWVFKINQVISVCHEYRVNVAPLGISRTKCKRFYDSLSLSSDHYIWNIFADCIHHTSSYIERLLFLYSKIISPLMITVIWHGMPVMQNLDSIDPYSEYLDWYLFVVGFGSSLISFLIHGVQYKFQPHHSMNFTIPMIVLSNSFLITFGFWIPFYSSVRIIMAWLFGLLLDLVIFTNLLKMLRKLIYGSKLLDTSKGISYDSILKEIELQRETLHKIFESIFVFKLHQMAIPLKGKKFRHRKREDIRRSNLAQQLKDLVMFGIYVIILHAVVSNEKDHLVYQDYNVLVDMFSGRLTRTRDLYQNYHISDVYAYLNSTLIEAMHSRKWYSNRVNEEPGMLIDRSNKYIGVARIRQHRVVPAECDVEFIPEDTVCSPTFSGAVEDQRTFEDGWDRPTRYLSASKRMSSMWIYSFASTTGSTRYLGLFSVYPGSGYVANLGRTRYNSILNFNVIKDQHWIDRFTRSIFIEFLTYSANYNLFNSVRVVIERSPTGLINCRAEIEPARMMYVGGELESRFLLYSIFFVVWLGVLFLNKTKLILRERLTFLKNFWSLLDLVIIIISLCTIIIYVARIKSIGKLLNTLERVKHNEFVNYFGLFHVHLTLNVIGSILVSASTIRLWKLVRFFKVFRMFEKTILLVMKPVIALLLHHFFFMIACTMSAHILFGENSKAFESFWASFKSLIQIYLNLYKGYRMSTFRSGLTGVGMALIVAYVFVSMTLFSIYIVIVVSSHLDTKELFSQPQEELYSFLGYVKEELMFLFKWFRPKILHHKELSSKRRVIYPKPDKYLYANCVSTTTHVMNSMTAVAATVLYNQVHKGSKEGLTDKQTVSMLRVCHFYLSQHIVDDHKEFFYKVLHAKTMRVIDSKRIDKAKHIAEIILGVPGKMEKKQKMNRIMVLRNTLRDLEKADRKLDVCYRSLQNIQINADTE